MSFPETVSEVILALRRHHFKEKKVQAGWILVQDVNDELHEFIERLSAANERNRIHIRNLDLLDLAVREMRKFQKEYFRTRTGEALRLAKDAEKRVDAILSDIDRENEPQQQTLL